MVKYFTLLFLALPLCASAQTNYEVFKGESVKTVTAVRLVEPYFCTYRDSNYNPIRLKYRAGLNSQTTPEDIIQAKYCGNYNGLPKVPVYKGTKPDSTEKNGLVLIHKLTFFWQGTETAIVKFAEMKDSIMGKPIVIQLQKAGNIWNLSEIKEINYIEKVIASIRTDMFWEIYTKADGQFPTINQMKKKVKDEEGLLNINMLSEYLNSIRVSDNGLYLILCDN